MRVDMLLLPGLSTSPQKLGLTALMHSHLLNCIILVSAAIKSFDAAMLKFSLEMSIFN